MTEQNHANTVEKQSTRARDGGANTAQQPASKPPTDNGGRYAPSNVTEHFYLPSGFTRNCDHCGRAYTAKRDTSKYCGGTCRKRAFDARQAGQ